MEWVTVVTALAVVILLCIDPVTAQSNGGLSGLAIGLIVAGIIILVVFIAVIGICCVNYKRKHLGQLELEHPEFERTGTDPYYKTSAALNPVPTQVRYDGTSSDTSLNRTATADSDGDAVSVEDGISPSAKNERREKFEQQLMEMMPHANTFLEMSQDVQERIKNAKHGNPRINGYKAVSRDLSRVQHLLSKRNSSGFKMPPDGMDLLLWASEARGKYVELQRYKSLKDSGDTSQPPEMTSIMWIQSKDDSAFEDKSYDESAII